MGLLGDLWGGMWSTRHRRLLKRKERERRAIRGHGTWTQQQNRVAKAQRAKTLAVRGRGSWTAQQNRADARHVIVE